MSQPQQIDWPETNPAVVNERGLPASVETEKLILGSILLDGSRYADICRKLMDDDFALEKHRRIFQRMADLDERCVPIDRVTLAQELARRGELESVDGLSYLVTLDDGLPQISNLDAYTEIILEKSRLRQIAMLSQHAMNRSLADGGTSDEILSGLEEQILGMAGRRADRGLRSPSQIISETEGGINAFLSPAKREQGISTGFTRFDEMTGGLRAGELIIIGARPSMGKTALALNIAWRVADQQELPVAIFSLEMSEQSLLTRALCAAAHVDSQRFRAGYLNEQERHRLRKAAQRATEIPFLIDDSASSSLMDIKAKTRGKKFGLVVIDYLQLMSSKKRRDNRHQEVGENSRGLKILSKELGCPILLLSQLSRAVETRTGDHRPQLSDLKESGDIEQDADIVGFIFRPEVYHRDREDLRGVAELIIGKSRNGPVGTVDLVFLHSQTRFENRAGDLTDEEERLPYAD